MSGKWFALGYHRVTSTFNGETSVVIIIIINKNDEHIWAKHLCAVHHDTLEWAIVRSSIAPSSSGFLVIFLDILQCQLITSPPICRKVNYAVIINLTVQQLQLAVKTFSTTLFMLSFWNTIAKQQNEIELFIAGAKKSLQI